MSVKSLPDPKDHSSDGHSCDKCPYSEICLPGRNASPSDLSALSNIIDKRRGLNKGDILYKAGDPLLRLYAIKSGSLKIYSLSQAGDEQITGFSVSGEIVGFDAIYERKHKSFAQALESTAICEIDFAQLSRALYRHPEMNLRFMRLMSHEISVKKELMMMISRENAPQRLASFLLHLSQAQARRNLAPNVIKLTMTRYEIGNCISLSVETISRLFSRLAEAGVITVKGRYITILDQELLREVENGNLCQPAKAENAP